MGVIGDQRRAHAQAGYANDKVGNWRMHTASRKIPCQLRNLAPDLCITWNLGNDIKKMIPSIFSNFLLHLRDSG